MLIALYAGFRCWFYANGIVVINWVSVCVQCDSLLTGIICHGYVFLPEHANIASDALSIPH